MSRSEHYQPMLCDPSQIAREQWAAEKETMKAAGVWYTAGSQGIK